MKTYLVGGAVRDGLLGLPVRERDWVVVGATGAQMLARGFRRLDSDFPVFLDPEHGEEYALARRERKTGPGYKGFAVEVGPDVTLEQDLARRDLTVNAIARATDGTLIDPYGGRDDLDRGLLRHVTPAFAEDPVRLLRAARFAARLGRWGFRIAHGTFRLLRRMATLDELDTVVPDRLREEMYKALAAGQPWRFFETLHRCGALARLIPSLALEAAGSHADSGAAAPLEALRRAVVLSDEPAVRLVALMAGPLGDPARANRWAMELRLDRAARELLERVLAWPPGRMVRADAPTWVGLLDRLKALHDPAALRCLTRVWRAWEPQAGECAGRMAERALAAVSAVRAAELAGEGLAGRELGQRLRERRLEALADMLRTGV